MTATESRSLSLIRKLIPAPVRNVMRVYRDRALDARDAILGRNDPLVPPRRLVFVGNSQTEFRQIGRRWVETFADAGGLRKSDRVLDVGCGVGRMAVPLTEFLDNSGSYEGMDIVREGIEWCQQNITPRFPRFRFQVSDIYNKEYNPTGKHTADAYRFPYPDAEFDFAWLTSVFTHMLPADVDHYLAEVSRVLKPGGRCLITYFLLNDGARQKLREGDVQQGRQFRFEVQGCLTVDSVTPEVAIAYPEEVVRAMYARHGLVIDSVHYGAWRKFPGARHGQDFIVAVKNA